jgi:hypothetical protein
LRQDFKKLLRSYVREVIYLNEMGGPVGASGSDPTDVKGFYPYEIERGVDIHSYWYKSPGRSMGGDGDPFRPSNALEYIGMARPADAGETNAEGETPVEDPLESP